MFQVKNTDKSVEKIRRLQAKFTQVLELLCNAIDEDCRCTGSATKLDEVIKLRDKYRSISDKVSDVIAELEENPVAAEIEQIDECMAYLISLQKNVEETLKNNEQVKRQEAFGGHVCTNPEMGKGDAGRRVEAAGSNDAIPYTPSLKSLPFTPTSSQESFSMKYKTETDSEGKTVYGSTALSEFDSVFNSRSESRQTLTTSDSDECSTVNIGKSLESVKGAIAQIRSKLRPQCNKLLVTDGQPVEIYDRQGNRLTSPEGHPLLDKSGETMIRFSKNQIPLGTRNGEPLFDQYGLPLIQNWSSPLINQKGSPLQIFNVDGLPLTDEKGKILKLKNGQFAVEVDKWGRIKCTTDGGSIYDAQGCDLHKKDQSKEQNLTEDGKKPILYNLEGFPLTNNDGVPLKNSKGEVLVKINENDHYSDTLGRPVYTEEGKPYRYIETKKLILFDCNKYPLTDSNGNVLKTAGDKDLVVFEDGKPARDCFHRIIFDNKCVPSNDSKFQPFSIIEKRRKKINFECGLYDFRGYPLLDFDGSSLTSADGRDLVQTNLKGIILYDMNKHPIYDKIGIPVTKVDGLWINPKGEPYRVFDETKRPLTNKFGEPLFDVNGMELLKCDHFGRPIHDRHGRPVFDAKGNASVDPEFNPSINPPSNDLKLKVFVDNKPLKIFDKKGQPLTDSNGLALSNADGHCLLIFNGSGVPTMEFSGQPIYDEHQIPLGCKLSLPILSPTGMPLRLYDINKKPLTNKDGVPLFDSSAEPLLKFDSVGRPSKDKYERPVFDSRGRQLLLDPRADPVECPRDPGICLTRQGLPVSVHDKNGYPLTDPHGYVLVNSDGSHVKIEKGLPVADSDGSQIFCCSSQEVIFQKETDIFGRPLYDRLNRPMFDMYGRPIYDLYLRPLYDTSGRPVATAYGKRLVDDTDEPLGVSTGFDTNCLVPHNPSELPEYTDLNGGPLFDSLGLPLYNVHGKPLLDAYGRSLYDDDGIPLSDHRGRPASELVRQRIISILDVQDTFKLLQLPPEVGQKFDPALAKTRRKDDSRNSTGIWTVTMSGEKEDTETNESPLEFYWARVRITSFEDGTKSFEILEAVPLPENLDM